MVPPIRVVAACVNARVVVNREQDPGTPGGASVGFMAAREGPVATAVLPKGGHDLALPTGTSLLTPQILAYKNNHI